MASFKFKPQMGTEKAIQKAPIKQGSMSISTDSNKIYFDVSDDKRIVVGEKCETYVHNQTTVSDTWNIKHNLQKFPSITVIDTAGTQVIGKIEYVDENNIKLSFSSAFSGKAYLN